MPHEILINFFNMNTVGHQSPGLWKHPRDRSRAYRDLETWTDLAKTLERGLVDVNGLLETKPVEDVANRAWNYVAVGCGRDLQWWKEFFSVVRMMGYNDWVSLEMEDLTMSVEAGIKTSIDALKQTISQ